MTPLQAPIGSRFGAASTAEEVVRGVDLSGKTAIVTGGYAGIGLETTRTLRLAGARVIVPARDQDKARRALADLPGVDIEPMDLLDPAAIDGFAASFLARGEPLHLLVNNAGIMACPLARDARGYESQLATNHLGHFQLVERLWPALRRAAGARVVCVSSWGHRLSPFVFDDPNFERRAYDRWSAYGQSKTANILFARALDQRGRPDGVRAFSLHPGAIVDTDLKRHLSDDDLRATGVFDEHGRTIRDPSRQLKTLAQGAATTVWCATSPQLDGLGGVYCENCEVARPVPADQVDAWKLDGATRTFGVMPHAIDPAAAERLWTASEALLRGQS
ncbi:oxidoreductase [Nannocystis punicea]|uniref:Oxidoreductase n=1 Tax=Nannocystis punicea TaxID=2995304 RepID=A0ABY7HC02_9BACT|nr:oxidoreductase [Nannocystis poenicansa]WAS96792.1 oxidoreductase [Nannocystis poenicansa]